MATLPSEQEEHFGDISSIPRNQNFTFSEVRAHDSDINFPAVIPTAALESLLSPLVCTHTEHPQLCGLLMHAFAFLRIDLRHKRTQTHNTLIWLLFGENKMRLREDFTKDALYTLPMPDEAEPLHDNTQELQAWLTLEDKARVMFYILFSEKKKFADTVVHHGFLPDKLRQFILCFPFHRQITRGMKTDDCFNDLDHLCAPDLDLLELFRCTNRDHVSTELDELPLLYTLFFFAKHMCMQTNVLPLSNWYGAFDILFQLLQDAPNNASLFSSLMPERVTTVFANQPIRDLLQHKEVFLKYARIFSIFVRGIRVQFGHTGSGFEPVKRKANGTATKPWTNTYDSAKKDPLFHWLSIFFSVVRNIGLILRKHHVESSRSWCIRKMEAISQTHAEYLLCSYYVMDGRNQEQAAVLIDDGFSWTRIRGARKADIQTWLSLISSHFNHKIYRTYYNSFVEETTGESVSIFCGHRKLLLSRCLISYMRCALETRHSPILNLSLIAPLVVEALCTEPDAAIRLNLWTTYYTFLGGDESTVIPREDVPLQHEILACIAKEWKFECTHSTRYEKIITTLMTYHFFRKHIVLLAPLRSLLNRLAKDVNIKSIGSTVAKALISELDSLVGSRCVKLTLKHHGSEPFVVLPNHLVLHLLKTLLYVSNSEEIDQILDNWKRQQASVKPFPFLIVPAHKKLVQTEDLLSTEWGNFTHVSKTAYPTQSYCAWESMLSYAELTIRGADTGTEKKLVWSAYSINVISNGSGSMLNHYKHSIGATYNEKDEFVYLYPDTDLVMLISHNNHTLVSDRCMNLFHYPRLNMDAISMRALAPSTDGSTCEETDTLGVALMSVN